MTEKEERVVRAVCLGVADLEHCDPVHLRGLEGGVAPLGGSGQAEVMMPISDVLDPAQLRPAMEVTVLVLSLRLKMPPSAEDALIAGPRPEPFGKTVDQVSFVVIMTGASSNTYDLSPSLATPRD